MDFPVQKALELACAAQRYNNCYQKESETLYTDDGKSMGYKHSNKILMLWTLDQERRAGADPQYLPPVITTNESDRLLTEDIRTYYRRLMFSVLAQPDNQFLQEILSLLNKETMNENKLGFIACLPSVYERDRKRNDVNKAIRDCENSYLADKETKLIALNATIVDCTRSKNFDAYNVLAIIDNKLASWFSKFPIRQNKVEIISAKVKDNNQNWLTKKAETRLNYVKVKNENSSN
jgi:hypothetical protein